MTVIPDPNPEEVGNQKICKTEGTPGTARGTISAVTDDLYVIYTWLCKRYEHELRCGRIKKKSRIKG